jgi:hypothetical protein
LVAYYFFIIGIKRESGLNPELYPQLYANQLVVIYIPLFAPANEKVNNKTQARRPAVYIE